MEREGLRFCFVLFCFVLFFFVFFFLGVCVGRESGVRDSDGTVVGALKEVSVTV